MKTHTLNLKQVYFDLIKSGKKDIELRLYDSKRRLINPGDMIIFQTKNDCHTVKVKGLIRAENFESLFDIINVKNTGFQETNKAIKTLEGFYDKDTQKKFGVVGIIIENL